MIKNAYRPEAKVIDPATEKTSTWALPWRVSAQYPTPAAPVFLSSSFKMPGKVQSGSV